MLNIFAYTEERNAYLLLAVTFLYPVIFFVWKIHTPVSQCKFFPYPVRFLSSPVLPVSNDRSLIDVL